MKIKKLLNHKAIFVLVVLAVFILVIFPASWCYPSHFGGSSTGTSPSDQTPPPPPDECKGQAGGMIYLWDGREHFKTTDLIIPGRIPIVVSRSYDSASSYDSPLGYGWSLNYNIRLYENRDGSIIMRTKNGYRFIFVQDGGAYVTPRGIKGRLEEDGSGNYIFIEHKGRRQYFDPYGRLTSIEDPSGNRLVMEYDSRGKLPLSGISPYGTDLQSLVIVAYDYRLTRVKEQDSQGQDTGRYVDFIYDDAPGRVTKARDNTGREILYGHDAKWRLTSVTDPNGNVRSYEYNDPNDMYNITDFLTACGSFYEIAYDAKDRVILETKNNGTLAMDYENQGIPLVKTVVTRTVKDDSEQTLHTFNKTVEFDEYGKVISSTDTVGNVTEYIRDGNGNILSRIINTNTGTVQDPVLEIHSQVDYTYDTDANKLTEAVILDSGETVTKTFTYDHNRLSSSTMVSSTDPTREFKTEYTFHYDTQMNPTKIYQEKQLVSNNPETWLTTTYEYDGNSQLSKLIAPNGDQKNFTYTNGLLTNEDGVAYTYDEWGNRDSVTDKLGNTTDYIYDAGNRLIEVKNPLDQKTVYTYSGCNLTQMEYGIIRNEAGKIVSYGYDATNRLTSVTLGNGATAAVIWQYAYDSENNIIARTDGDGNIKTYSFDENNRLASITEPDPLLHQTQFEYNFAENLIKKIDGNTKVTEYTYDDLNRLVGVKDALNQTVAYTYDAAGRLLSLEDAQNHTHTFTYNLAGRLKTEARPLEQTFQYFYDPKGRLIKKIDAENQETNYTYNTDDMLLTAVFGNPAQRTVTLARDPNGNVETYADTALLSSGAIYMYTYDVLNRATVVADAFLNKTLENTYDKFGMRSNLTVKEGLQVLFAYDYAYDDKNFPASLTLPGSQTVTIENFASGRLKTVTYPNGMTANHTYHTNGLLDALEYKRADASVLAGYVHTFDNAGNIDTITAPEGLHQFDYDDTYQVTGAVHPNITDEAFTYDPAGNRDTSADYTNWSYDENNRLQGYGNITFTYNNNGSVTGKTVGGNTTSYSYNLANRLTQVTAAGLNASHGYDFFGRRVEKNVNGQITRFLYDGTTLMAELDQTNSITKRYAYLPGRLTPFVMVEEEGSSSAANTDLKFLETLAGLYNAFDGITPLAYAARPSGPSITRVQPSQCEPGELIIITGKKLGDTQGASVVHIGSDTFDSSSSRIELWSNKEIRIRVPDYACEWFGGQDFKEPDVWVTVGGADSNMKTLKILKPASCTSTGGSGTYYFINNHLGYPQKLVDDNLTVVWSSSSQVFGLATINEDPDGNGQTVVNNIRFPGQYYDTETGLHYNYHRFYDPSIGRYLRTDPIGIEGGLNLFAYTLNNPVNFADPEGKIVIIGSVGMAMLIGGTAIVIYHYINNPPSSPGFPDYNEEKRNYRKYNDPKPPDGLPRDDGRRPPPPKNCFEGCRDEFPCSGIERWVCYLGCLIGQS